MIKDIDACINMIKKLIAFELQSYVIMIYCECDNVPLVLWHCR